MLGYRSNGVLARLNLANFPELELEPALWTLPQSPPVFVSFTQERRNPVTGAQEVVRKYRDVTYARRTFNSSIPNETGWTNLGPLLAEHWFQQEALNYRNLGALDEPLPTVAVTANAFFETFLDLEQDELGHVVLEPFADDNNEAYKRIDGSQHEIGAFGWAAFTDGVVCEKPFWITHNTQTQRVRGKMNGLCGWLKGGVIMGITPYRRPHTVIGVSRNNSTTDLFSEPGAYGYGT